MRGVRRRAGKPQHGGAKWDDSGFFVQRLKMLGSGELAREVTEFEFDAAIVRELGELEDQIAREKGDHKLSIEPPKPQDPDMVVRLAELFTEEELETAMARAKQLQDEHK